MRLPAVATLFNTTALALLLGACQAASNGPNAALVTPASTTPTPATVAATPGSVPATNTSLVDFVVPQTFKTFSANNHYEQGSNLTRDTTYALNPVYNTITTTNPLTGVQTTQQQLAGHTRINPTSPTLVYTGNRTGTLYEGEQPQNLSDKLTIIRDPRSATFSVKVNSGAVVQDLRWQDPQHRTLFPQDGIPGNSLYDSFLTTDKAKPASQQRVQPNLQLPDTGNAAYDDYLYGRNLATTPDRPYFGSNRDGANGSQIAGDAGVARNKLNIEYYEAGTSQTNGFTAHTLFFERVGQAGAAGSPGTNKYVTWAGLRSTVYTNDFSRAATVITNGDGNDYNDTEVVKESEQDKVKIDRSAFVFGMNSLAKDIPKTGTATYEGSLFANYIYTAPYSGPATDQTKLDTIWGKAISTVTFATDAIGINLSGKLETSGENFSAIGSAIIQRPDIPNAALNATAEQPISRFVGSFSAVTIGTRALTPNINASLPNTFQASTVEGGFFGPTTTGAPVELGAAFRIVGGVPDERLDILGAFIGARTK